jgi:molybdate transport system ATP-binding protein
VVPAALPGDPAEAGDVSVLPATRGDVLVAVPPAAVVVHRRRPEGSSRNVWPAVVDTLVVRGDQVRVSLRGDVPLLVDVTAAAVAELGLVAGTPVWASVKAQEVACYPA